MFWHEIRNDLTIFGSGILFADLISGYEVLNTWSGFSLCGVLIALVVWNVTSGRKSRRR